MLDALPGAKSSSCLDVGLRGDVRSGSFAMGNFVTARREFSTSNGGYGAPDLFFYVIPDKVDLKRVVVTLTSPGQKRVNFSTREVSEAAQWKYFPVHVHLPGPGEWSFHVSSAGQRGCFVARFSS